MGIRPARCYRNSRKSVKRTRGDTGHARRRKPKRAFSRLASARPERNYIGASPQLKIRQFNMGNPLLKYDTVADVVVKDSLDIRDNALESVRSTVNRKLVKDLGKDFYFMKVRVFPSQIMRENKQAQGAGADRVSQGMTQAYGIPIGRSARVKKGQAIFSVLCFEYQKEKVKTALSRARAKVSCQIDIVFHKDIKSLGTLPSKAIEEKVVEVKKDEATLAAEAAAATPGAEGAAGKAPAAGAKGAPAAGKGPAAAPAAGAKGAPAAKPAGKK
ncbi:MAG: 50S ribosomal protein L16 [archaeon]